MGNISEAKLAKDLSKSDAYIMVNSVTSVRGKKYNLQYKVSDIQSYSDEEWLSI